MTAETEHGYLILADISGYTSYLAKVELRMKIYKPEPLWLSRFMIKAQFARNDPYLEWFKSTSNMMKTSLMGKAGSS